MDFIEAIKIFADKASGSKDHIQTEEATKISLVMPFIQLLGYNVFDPTEVIPEYTADVGTKRGEKVDYAIIKGGNPIILIEVKSVDNDLSTYSSQLYRYFSTTHAKFAIYTNGYKYHFFSDLREDNKMDSTPFLEFDLLNINEIMVSELKKFRKEIFNADNIISSASTLKYTTEIKKFIDTQIKEPSDGFTRYFLHEIYEGKATKSAISKFKPIVRRAFNQYINDLVNEKIKSALDGDEMDVPEKEGLLSEKDVIDNGIVTTEDEVEGYYILKSILREIVDVKRIIYKDTKSYCGILLDGNIRKWICRFYFNNPKNKSITLPDLNRHGEILDKKSTGEMRYNIEELEDIYNYKDELIEILKNRL